MVKVETKTGCAWTAFSNASWITITSNAKQTGDGTVTYVVASNPEIYPRMGTLTIAGKIFTVTQSGISAGVLFGH